MMRRICQRQRILYVGTRDGLAIYRPAAGAWQRAGHTLAGSAIATIMALDAQTLLVAVEGQPAQQSFDGGATWSVAQQSTAADRPSGRDAPGARLAGLPAPERRDRLRAACRASRRS